MASVLVLPGLIGLVGAVVSPPLPVINNYVYAWNPVRAWRGTCATFTLTLDDGTVHTADFRFT